MRTTADLLKKSRQVNEVLKEAGKGINMATIKPRLQALKNTNIVAFNDLANVAFIEVVRRLVEANDLKPVEFVYARKNVSYDLGISIPTVNRYFDSHTATRAELRMFGKKVYLNPDFVPADQLYDDEGESE